MFKHSFVNKYIKIKMKFLKIYRSWYELKETHSFFSVTIFRAIYTSACTAYIHGYNFYKKKIIFIVFNIIIIFCT